MVQMSGEAATYCSAERMVRKAAASGKVSLQLPGHGEYKSALYTGA